MFPHNNRDTQRSGRDILDRGVDIPDIDNTDLVRDSVKRSEALRLALQTMAGEGVTPGPFAKRAAALWGVAYGGMRGRTVLRTNPF